MLNRRLNCAQSVQLAYSDAKLFITVGRSMAETQKSSLERNLEYPPSLTIPQSSPVYPLQNLQTGWDGYWAAPLSQLVLLRAHDLWLRIKQNTLNETELPKVQPAANGSVAFTWSNQYPAKELEIWLYNQPNYHAEWMLSTDEDIEGTARTQAELLSSVFIQFLWQV
jgi:hypothetical protein